MSQSVLIDVAGQRFGKLTVISRNYERRVGYTRSAWWNCRCECGRQTVVRGADLRNGNSKSCGCTRGNKPTHGLSHSSEYFVLSTARQRCTNPNVEQYKNYGGRGIRFNFKSVGEATKWVLDNLGRRPVGCSLDRIDNDGNYEPGNLRWATDEQQINNQRRKRIEDFSDEELWAELERRVPCLTSRCQ